MKLFECTITVNSGGQTQLVEIQAPHFDAAMQAATNMARMMYGPTCKCTGCVPIDQPHD